VLPVILPNITVPGFGLFLILSWTDLPNNSSNVSFWRLYRSPFVGASITQMEWLADTASRSAYFYQDRGETNTSTINIAKVNGNLGKWHQVAGVTLNTARYGVAATVSQSPTTPQIWFIHALGGKRANDTVIDSYEVLKIDTSAYGQVVSNWVETPYTVITATADSAATVLPTSEQCGACAAQTQNSIYVFAGESAAAPATKVVWTALVDNASGLLSNLQLLTDGGDTKSDASGICVTFTAFTYLLMGSGNTATQLPDIVVKGQEAQQTTAPPALGGSAVFNPSPAAVLANPSRYLACAASSGLLYFVGGVGGTGVALNDVLILAQ